MSIDASNALSVAGSRSETREVEGPARKLSAGASTAPGPFDSALASQRYAQGSGYAQPVSLVDDLTGLSAARFAIYIHFPFCLSKCPYCDFASIVARQIPQERYTEAILRELRTRAEPLGRREAHAIYFGGGTPSLWRPALVASVIDAVCNTFALAAGAEVTLEANPGASDAERFRDFRSAGVNRLSIGVQSFQPSTLKALGREHDGPTAVRAYEAARAAGFDNVSLDFIYGVQGQDRAQAVDDARRAAALGPEHLSAYALTLDKEALAEEVPLAKQLARGEVKLPSDDETIDMARAVRDVYASAGLARYEISNFAREGYHSRHNAAYWTGGDWLALGVGATGTLGDARYTNPRSAEQYLAGAPAARESLSRRELFEERLAMGLRLSNGIDVERLCERFGEPYAPRAATVQRLVADGFATMRAGRLALTGKGADLHSAICARLF